MTLYELVEQLGKMKCIKTIRYNKHGKYAIIYFHRISRNDIDTVVKLIKEHRNIMVSTLRHKNMIILRER